MPLTMRPTGLSLGRAAFLGGALRNRAVNCVNYLTLRRRKICEPYFAKLNATHRGCKCA
jgi:hypothetical protein